MDQFLRLAKHLVLLLATIVGCGQIMAADSKNDGDKWTLLNGDALRRVFENVELGDGVHYSYRFFANGTFNGTEMGRDVHGAWRTTAKELCWRWIRPPGKEECYTVERKGRELRAFRNGYETWWGELSPLAPPSSLK